MRDGRGATGAALDGAACARYGEVLPRSTLPPASRLIVSVPASSLRAAALAAAASFWCACTEESTEPSAAPTTVRLSSLLDRATIDSPVTKIAAVRSLDALGDAATEELLAEDFEAFDPRAVGWPVSESAAVAEVDGRRVLVLDRFEPKEVRRWVVPAEPGAHYLFERSVASGGPLAADFAVIETTAPGPLAQSPETQFALGAADALQLHWPSPPRTDGSWQRGSVSFLTTPQTHSLTVVLRATADGSAHELEWNEPARSPAAAKFDDLRLCRVRPDSAQAIALVKAQDLADGADPELGIEKFGQLAPLAELGFAHGPHDDNFSWRAALYAPPPTDLRFPVRIGRGAVLRFSVCLSRQTEAADAAAFAVLVRDGGEEKEVWSRTLAAAAPQWRWHEARVDLAPFADRDVELVLRTRAVNGAPHPMWGNPAIDTPPASGRARDVILIAIDTLRADRLSCYGWKERTSPHIDALAADGVRFEHALCNANWTCPSFASIFTGVVPARHGVWASAPIMPLPPHLPTIAQCFRAAGFATQAIVYKSVLYGGGYERGFDVSLNVPRTTVRADDNLTEAMEWLESSDGRRNFLFLHFDDPHQPFNQPAPFDRAFGADPRACGVSLPADFGNEFIPEGRLRELARVLYDGEVAYVDDRIGAFLAALKERGRYDDAVIALVADHGEALWEHGVFGHGRSKIHDEVVRVPLIVKAPRGRGESGRVVATQVRGFDVMPTLLELAGIAQPPDLDAVSLMPLIDAPDTDAPDRLAVVETSRDAVALRTRKSKYILRYGKRPAAFAADTLYDLERDPGETTDVAARAPETVAAMRAQVIEYFLLHKPGRYVVAVGGDVTLHGARAVLPLVGEAAAPAAGGARRLASAAGWIAAEVEADGPLRTDQGGPALAPRRYAAGDLARLLEKKERTAVVFDGPPRAAATAAPAQDIDLQQLEAMRALGYAGAGGTPTDDGDK